jgi:hypothetical protein
VLLPVIDHQGNHRFLGELNVLSSRRAILTAGKPEDKTHLRAVRAKEAATSVKPLRAFFYKRTIVGKESKPIRPIPKL